MARCFQIHADDNVATMLDDVAARGFADVLGSANLKSIKVHDAVTLGHKVAVRDIAEGEPIVKFGVPIGRATRAICAGEWVHLHNCASTVDERSGTLDVHTGAATDTKYE